MKYTTDTKKAKIWIWQNESGYLLFTEINDKSECIIMTEEEAKKYSEKFKLKIKKSRRIQ